MRRDHQFSSPFVYGNKIMTTGPLLVGLALIANLSQFTNFVDAKIHTEGGSFPRAQQPNLNSAQQEYEREADIVELINSNRHPIAANNFIEEDEEEENGPNRRELAGIVSELAQLRNAEMQAEEEEEGSPLESGVQHSNLPKPRGGRAKDETTGQSSEIEELRKFGAKIKELATQEQQEANGTPEYEPELIELEQQQPEEDEEDAVPKPKGKTEKPLTAQKKGQSEFVEFVEPAHHVLPAKKLKNVEIMEKRVASESRLRRQQDRGLGLISTSGNVVFIAFVTMCCVLSVVGIVGGAYYYNHVRSIREDPFDDFTRYSPAGPGRDKQLKKGKNSGGTNFTSEKGDDSLAYRAQLHHYQQTKQKIIGGGDEGIIGGNGNGNGHVMNVDEDASDRSDDEGDLEHNFSVYECPGLAPTGDIEVQNPNFVEAGRAPPPYHPRKDMSSPTQ